MAGAADAVSWYQRGVRAFVWSWRALYAAVGAGCSYLAMDMSAQAAPAGGIALFCLTAWLALVGRGVYCVSRSTLEREEPE